MTWKTYGQGSSQTASMYCCCRSSRRSGKGTSASRRSRSRSRRRGRRSSTSSKKRRAFRPKHALDMDNPVYLHLRMEAHRRRVQRDIMAEHMEVRC